MDGPQLTDWPPSQIRSGRPFPDTLLDCRAAYPCAIQIFHVRICTARPRSPRNCGSGCTIRQSPRPRFRGNRRSAVLSPQGALRPIGHGLSNASRYSSNRHRSPDGGLQPGPNSPRQYRPKWRTDASQPKCPNYRRQAPGPMTQPVTRGLDPDPWSARAPQLLPCDCLWQRLLA